ncbi:MAG: N-acetylneuraminate synthase family protein [Candidatus Staskawiczbacteria bacterium]|nr:N-acetylneuraminate synthase family protein [Candidatus Staskawiczbacteria bacterium]
MYFKIGEKLIGQDKPVFIIAEAGSNHDGNLGQAKKLIDVAAEAKADAVKFQLFKAEKLYPPNCGKISTPYGEVDLYDFFKNASLTLKWLPLLKKYSESKGLIFIVTPFDEKSADELAKINLDVYKIASSELNHLPLIKHVAKNKKAIIFSTGLSKLSEIEEAIDTAIGENNQEIILLHCVSSYPAPPEEYNLRIINNLKNIFQLPVGVSDHSIDPILIPRLAVLAGANVIEKHFTLDKNLPGADHHYAQNPKELKLMVKEIRKTEKWSKRKKEEFLKNSFYQKIFGSGRKIIAPSEKEIYPGDKRSIFVVRNLKKGDRLNKSNLAVLRAERYLEPGIHPRYFNLVLGKKVVKPIKKYNGLQWGHLLNS